jgi:hypothetical protein
VFSTEEKRNWKIGSKIGWLKEWLEKFLSDIVWCDEREGAEFDTTIRLQKLDRYSPT